MIVIPVINRIAEAKAIAVIMIAKVIGLFLVVNVKGSFRDWTRRSVHFVTQRAKNGFLLSAILLEGALAVDASRPARGPAHRAYPSVFFRRNR